VSRRLDRCSLRSEAVDEPLAGTASTIRRWMLVEHPGPWGRDGLLDARMPHGLGRQLRALERRTRARVLLIRRPARTASLGSTCFAVDTLHGWIGSTSLESVSDAAGLDPTDPLAFPQAVGHAVAVVCTHGRRDPCCAERGRPLAAAASARFPNEVWESTHVGGDRFAGNMVVFPHGLVFGRVEPSHGVEILEALAQARILLEHYRGRTSMPMPTQAADRAVRADRGLDGLDDVRHLGTERDGRRARVRLGTASGETFVHLTRIELPATRLTCASSVDEAAATWRVDSIDLLAQ
jgi:hypothetical protein